MNPKALIAGILISLSCLQSGAKGGGGSNAPMYDAAASGDVAKLKEYIGTNPDFALLKNDLLRTAALRGQRDSVEFLILQGADPNQRGFIDMTPLAHMAMYGTREDEKCAQVATVLLVHGAEVDPVDGYKATPLLHAVESKKAKLAEVLLEHGADLDKRYSGVNSGMTPLHMAVLDRDKEMVAVLLKFKAPIDATDRDGATPLLMAEGRNETEIAAMLREANPEVARRVPMYSIPPTKEKMRALAKRIAEGDDGAFDELATTAKKLYGEIKNYQKERARVLVLLSRMKAAFDPLGEEAGTGNDKAFQALKKCLGQKNPLQSFAPDALGIAAAGGNKEALDVLLHYESYDILESSAHFALCAPAEANVEPAVAYLVNWLLNINQFQRGGGLMLSATNALGKAAALGNEKAKQALEKFAANSPQAN